ncbi:c-type cytochrome [Dyella japonica]|uniref:Cytochrome C n=1 Tax=Dyella japonica A8 TaxID=1217721 RepID=A0A075K2S6_9GAMM|nr:cytochrome c [Dyella japonica]AIF48280.1 cytochrome C [Dyella japonica A8]
MKRACLLGWLMLALVAPHASSADAVAERGRYLATAADCAACHTQPGGGEAYAGNYAIESPLGTIWSSNITPSKNYGIGNYDEREFARALREGVRKDGAHLYPAMPYTSYAKLSDEDIHALYVYFMTEVTPVDRASTETHLPFPFNLRFSMAAWNVLFLDGKRFSANASHDEAWNRGAYLAEALEHCSACHTPRGWLMQELSRQAYAGAPLGSWYAPNITSDPVSGLGGWSDAELGQYLKTGRVPGKAQAAGGMAEAITHSLSQLSDADIAALVRYVRSIPPIKDATVQRPAFAWPGSPMPESAIRGTANEAVSGPSLYSGLCASCHGARGEGSRDGYYPSLTHNSTVGASRPDNLVAVVLFGVDRTVAGKHVLMPHFAEGSYVQTLDDAQVAAVLSYVRQTFGPGDSMNAGDVARIRQGGSPPVLLGLVRYGALVVLGIFVLLFGWWFGCRRRKLGARV